MGTYLAESSGDVVKGVTEIVIRVDKATNTLYANVSRALDPDDVGQAFIPPMTQIDLEPKIVQEKNASGCTTREQVSKAEGTRIVTIINETFKLGCWIRTSTRHVEITLQFSAPRSEEIRNDEIWIGVGEKAGKPEKRYRFRRISGGHA